VIVWPIAVPWVEAEQVPVDTTLAFAHTIVGVWYLTW
jgi:hypothetical protein